MLDLFQSSIDDIVERPVEILQQLHPVKMILLDFVELHLHARGKADVHDLGESLHQLISHDLAEHRCPEAAIHLHDILAILDRGDDAGVR